MDNKELAQGIASLGRYGDTTLMHMRPDEVEQLTALSRANGGDITINPDTGMPEAFLGNFISALAPTAAGLAAGAIFPGAPFLAPALAGGATAFLQGKRDPLSIGMGALGGYGGAQLGTTLRGFGAAQAAKPELAGTAELAGGSGGTPVADVATTGSTIGASGGTTAGANAFGQQQFISPFNPAGQQALGEFGTQSVTGALNPSLPATPGATYAGPQGMAETLGKGGFQPKVPLEGGGYNPYQSVDNFGAQQRAMADYTGNTSMMQSKRLGSFEQGIDLGKGLAETGKGFEAAMQDPMGYLKFAGEGSALMGGVKTALPFAGAGLEAYSKGMYEDMPTYEASMAGRYDPTRTLNLGMDTGLRLLAKGGEVKRYQAGGVLGLGNNFYQDTVSGRTYTGPKDPQGMPLYQDFERGGGAPPEYGIVDVGGNFVKTSDTPGEGLMSKTSYYETYKFKEPGYTAEANKQGDSGGDFDSKAGLQGGAGGINPAIALQAAQGYAESQQSNLDEQGLGTLKTGGSVRRFQMGGTTAERNMYGQQDSNQPTGLGSLTTAEQNLPGRQGVAGRTDLQNATTAEQNIAREPMQEAGTVVSSPMQNTMGAQPNDMASRLPMGPGDMNANVTESLGEALQSNPQGFTVIPNQSIPPTSGEAPMMAMGGRVRYSEGGISQLTPDNGKMLNGNGDGVSDDIPAMIEGEQEAALSDGEFIVPARIVSELGNGSSDAGAKKLYAMIDRIQAARQQTMGDNKQYAKDTNAERFLPV